MWKRIGQDGIYPYRLSTSDECYYVYDYRSKGGYSAGEGNQVISNLKKGPEKKGTFEWPHKEKAVARFAKELAQLLPKNAAVAFVPPSKTTDHSEYDPRFEMVSKELRRIRPDARVTKPFIRSQSIEAAHLGGTRNVQELKESLEWRGFDDPTPGTVWLIDDVLTTGAHFKACESLIYDHHRKVAVKGIFWAKTVWADDGDGDEGDFE